MKKGLCIAIVIISLLITGAADTNAHCKGPHGPTGISSDTSKK